LLEAAVHLESEGVVHTDLSLEHILVTPDGRLVMSHFSHAADVDPETVRRPYTRAEEFITGNPNHHPPEVLNAEAQVMGELDCSKIHSFAIGVLLYEICAGESPFSVSRLNCSGKLLQRSYEHKRVLKLPKKYPEWFRTVCHSLLAFNPKERPTAEQALKRLTANWQEEHARKGLFMLLCTVHK
jgi:serine/threonine protein kinase